MQSGIDLRGLQGDWRPHLLEVAQMLSRKSSRSNTLWKIAALRNLCATRLER
jgi:hypothetical protein